MRCRFAAIEKMVIRFPPLPGKLEFARRAGGQVVRQICVVVFALRRSVSFYGSTNWNLAGRKNVSFRTSPQTGVGISIEFWVTYRHTKRFFAPFSRFLSP